VPKDKLTKKARVEQIRQLLEVNDAAVEEALVAIYHRQTQDEKNTGLVLVSNGQGFTGVDAEFLTKMAEWVLRNENILGERLSYEQRIWTRKRIKKYAKQLERMNWFFVGSDASEIVSADDRATGGRSGSTRSYATRTDALLDAIRRIELGRAWLRDNPGHELTERAQGRLIRLAEWAEDLVQGATREDLANFRFKHLARYIAPCPDCSGTKKREQGACYRCRGKGFQTGTDEDRNARYDARKKA
jgi:hypothetical protein